jgi:Domain of unknown function (DUF5666)
VGGAVNRSIDMAAIPPVPASNRPSIGLVRIVVVGVACLVLALSAVVVLGASPNPPSVEPAASAEASARPDKVAQPRLKLPGLFRWRVGSMLEGRGGFLGAGRGAITITKIDGSTLDLRTDDGWTRTITVGADTKITKGGETATLGDLNVGDRIVMRQKHNDDGTYTVTAIAVPTPMLAGTVTAVGADTLTVKLRDGSSRTIHLTGATTYKLGRADGKKSDVKVGSVVVAAGSEGPGSDFTATAVRVQVRLDRVDGEVTAVSKDSITVKKRDGTTATINVGADTKLAIRGDTTPSLSEVKVGMRVLAVGTLGTDGKLDADTVFAGTPKVKPAASPNSSGNPG